MKNDKELALAMLDRVHRDTARVIENLLRRHRAEAKITKIEEILCELHTAIHYAQESILYGNFPHIALGKKIAALPW